MNIEKNKTITRLRAIEFSGGSHENLSAICDAIHHSDFGWTVGACESLRDTLVDMLSHHDEDTVELPRDADGKMWNGSEARVVTHDGKGFMDGLLWDGHRWLIFRHSADGKNWDTLNPAECRHEGCFRDIIQKAFEWDDTQENEDELVRMCERVLRERSSKPDRDEFTGDLLNLIEKGLGVVTVMGSDSNAVSTVLSNKDYNELHRAFVNKYCGVDE